jgi:hypothetical protein
MAIALVEAQMWRRANRAKVTGIESTTNTTKRQRNSATNAGLTVVAQSNELVELSLRLLDPIGSGLERFPLRLVLRAFFAGFLGLLLG